MIALCIVLYCADVFIYHNSPARSAFKAAFVIAAMAAAIYRMAQGEKEKLSVMEQAYADKIETAFENDKKGKTLLLKALLDYNSEQFKACIRKLNRLAKKGQPPRENRETYWKYDTLLLQIVSEVGGGETRVMFGDAGVCNFFIPAEKLKNHDFSDILYTWDCH